MDLYRGTSISEKIAIGKIYYYKRSEDTPYREEISDTEREIARFDAARDAALTELDALIRDAAGEVGPEEAAVFEGHRMMVLDSLYHDFVCGEIRQRRVNAEYAVAEAQAHFSRILLGVDDPLLRERAADVTDVSERLLRLLGGWTEPEGPAEPSILAADELMPSETMRFDRSKILAFVVRQGAANSHMAILTRAMNIPAILGVDVREDWDGRMAVADGCTGEVILDPDEPSLARMRERQRELEAREAMRSALRGKETVTRSGRKIDLYANIAETSDVDAALENDAEGIGLFRSEFLFLQTKGWPSEEEQYVTYRAVAEAVQGKKVVIRTLDAGADKQLPYLDLAPGERGVRVCLDRPEMFRTQLRAILRAAACGTVALMFPMVTSVEEVRACGEQLALARAELWQAGISFGDAAAGIMIETPEAVERSAALAREADFFCIGTNDLIPSLLGRDRQDAASDAASDLRDPRVAGAIRTAIENGHAAGIPVGICGEAAADTTLTKTLVDMGVDELSVAPGAVLKVREAVRKLD